MAPLWYGKPPHKLIIIRNNRINITCKLNITYSIMFAQMNLHTDSPPPSLVERMRGEFGPGFDPLLPGGKQLLKISRLYRSEA